eukprot:scaffold487002_cov30-Prasinocladus_malaysianus.AAC.1
MAFTVSANSEIIRQRYIHKSYMQVTKQQLVSPTSNHRSSGSAQIRHRGDNVVRPNVALRNFGG